MCLWTGCLLDQEKRMTGSAASKFNNLPYFLINCWGMRGFQSLLASFTLCPKKQSYQAQEDWKGRETGTIPTDILPREAGNALCCGKWEAEVSQSAEQVCPSLGMGGRDNGLLCHPNPCPVLLVSSPGPPLHLACRVHLHCVIPWCGNEGREIKVKSGWWQRSWEPWAYHSARQALVVWEEPRKSEKGPGNEPPSKTGRQKTPWTVRFPSFRSFVPSSSLCLGMLRECTKSLDKTNIWRSPQEAGRYY